MHSNINLASSRFSRPLPPRLQSDQARFLSSSTHEIGYPNNPTCFNCEDFDTRVNDMFRHLGYIESHLHENDQDSVGDLWNTKKKDKHTIHVPLKNLRVEFDASTKSLEECKDGLQITHQLLRENIHRLEGQCGKKQTTSLKCLISTTRADLLKFLQKGTGGSLNIQRSAIHSTDFFGWFLEELYEARCLRVLCENKVSNAKAELREFQQEAQEKQIFQKADFDYMANSSADSSILSANTGIRGNTRRAVARTPPDASKSELYAIWIHCSIILLSSPGKYPQYIGIASSKFI
ncbi:hypothetical protein DFH28DRAFT_1086210 [Melampsora americana]|nr:hypothetical protein DFH28DRAFT_1086210 [Melampsora americana]